MPSHFFSRVSFLRFSCAAAVWAGVVTVLEAAPPVVSNVRAGQRTGSQLVDIYYTVSDPDSAAVTAYLAISADGGTNYNVPVATLSGAFGAGVAVGADRHIVWNAGVDWGGQFSSRCRARIYADDGSGAAAPTGMVFIPPGTFQMGDNFGQAVFSLPVHPVYVSAFFMEKFEVTWQQWEDVRQWAQAHDYGFDNLTATGQGPEYPVNRVNWFQAVKWCNARSEKEGLTPVYYTDPFQTNVFRIATFGISSLCVRWGANGYRLPTEAEWEKAARGGLSGQHFPWPSVGSNHTNFVNGSMANYQDSGDPFGATTPVGYYNGGQTPLGTNMANGYGLYDMAGNVWEMCWDDSSWYPANIQSDPHGPGNSPARIARGGANDTSLDALRSSSRNAIGWDSLYANYGFRCVRSL